VDVAIGDGGVVLLLKAKKGGRNMASVINEEEEVKCYKRLATITCTCIPGAKNCL
jgi:hypothetical protein